MPVAHARRVTIRFHDSGEFVLPAGGTTPTTEPRRPPGAAGVLPAPGPGMKGDPGGRKSTTRGGRTATVLTARPPRAAEDQEAVATLRILKCVVYQHV